MTFAATHVAADGGLATWPAPDPSSPPGPRLDPALPVQLLEQRGNWAYVACSNGWRAWVDERRLLPVFGSAGASVPPVAEATMPAPVVTAVSSGSAGSATPPGWYPDEHAPAMLRWWDGERWLDQRRPAAGATPTTPGHATSGRRFGLASLASAGLAVCAFLPWIKTGGVSQTAFKIDAQFLVDYKHGGGGGVKVAHVLLIVAAGAVAASFAPAMRWLGRLLGGVGVLMATAFVGQSQRLISASSISGGVFSFLGVGVYVTFAVGVLVAALPGAKGQRAVES